MTESELDRSKERIARQLKDRRLQMNLSLQDLAKKSNVSVSMISRIERCEASPSTSTLSRLVDALDLSFSKLMAPQSEADVVVIKAGKHPRLEDGDNHFSRTCLSPILPGRGVDVVKVDLPVHGYSGELTGHHQEVKEYVYVLSGEVEVSVGGASYQLVEGDSMFYKAQDVHQFYNTGDDNCVFILVIDGQQ